MPLDHSGGQNGSSDIKAQEANLDWLDPILQRRIIGSKLLRREILDHAAQRIPKLHVPNSAKKWEAYAKKLRKEILNRVILRGAAWDWCDAETKTEWLDEIANRSEYRIRKLRFEAIPGLWIPGLLYEPRQTAGKVPGVLNVNGHENPGKALLYKQLRCINLAKRGMLALNVDWIGFGQLANPGLLHHHQTQLDLCGTSSVSVFYLTLTRALTVLRSLESVDSSRIAVAGLSGGGWQTLLIGALDTRIGLINPVAGFGTLATNIMFDDLGDAEQAACDLATVADYAHLAALVAPRPMLLTYNAYDDCCFEAYYVLPPILKAIMPVYGLYGKETNLRWHINYDPGTHNFEQDNREAFYAVLDDYFFDGEMPLGKRDIKADEELAKEPRLNVDLPKDNARFDTLAIRLSRTMPRGSKIPGKKAQITKWQRIRREQLRELVHVRNYEARAILAGSEDHCSCKVGFWWYKIGDVWTVPGVELTPEKPSESVVVVSDEGRGNAAHQVEKLLGQSKRIVAVDPFFFGESREIGGDDPLFCYPLLLSMVGERPLGLQASQIIAISRWVKAKYRNESVILAAEGPRASLSCLVSAALETEAIDGLDLCRSYGSLKQAFEENGSYETNPELFCFGLMEHFDILQVACLIAPRPIELRDVSDRLEEELSSLQQIYSLLDTHCRIFHR